MTAALNWLISIGGSPVDALLMFFVIGILMMWWAQKRARDAEVKDLTYKYETLNTNVFSMDKHTGHNGFKRGNSRGDFILDWDGKSEQLMTVKMFKKWVANQKKLMQAYRALREANKASDVQKTPEE